MKNCYSSPTVESYYALRFTRFARLKGLTIPWDLSLLYNFANVIFLEEYRKQN